MITSCTSKDKTESINILNKSIFTPLTIEELSLVLKSDTTFDKFYIIVNDVNKNTSDLNKAKYFDITYVKFQKYIKYNSELLKKYDDLDTKKMNECLKNYDKLCWNFINTFATPKAAEESPIDDTLTLNK